MRYSANLPIEEQRRLDQLHLGMGSGNSYREGGLASVNPFAQSLFPTPAILPFEEALVQDDPRRQVLDRPKKSYENEGVRPQIPGGEFGTDLRFNGESIGATVMGYHRRPKAGGGYEYHTTGNSADPLPRGGGWEFSSQPWPDDPNYYLKDDPNPIVMPQPEVMPRPGSITSPLPKVPTVPDTAPDPIFEYPPTVPEVMPSPGTTMPQPGYPLPGPPNRPPPDFPPFVALPTGQQQQEQQSGYTRRDNEKIRPPSIQLSRKHGGSLTQTVQNLLRNLS